jgi:hypothetical protein
MADQDKDWKSETPPTSTAGSLGGGTGSTGNAAGSGSRMANDSASGAGISGKASATESVKESGARIASEAKQYAGDMALRAKEKGRSMFEQQKDNAVGQVSSVAHAFRSTADHLQEDGQAQAAKYIALAADQLESLGGRLREKDLDTLVNDVQGLARRAPGAFLAGSVVAGFLLARFLKSSSERRSGYMETSDNEWPPASATETERYAAMSGGRASTGTAAADTTGISGSGSDLASASASDAMAPVAGIAPGTAAGTASVATTPSSLSGSTTGGKSYDNR